MARGFYTRPHIEAIINTSGKIGGVEQDGVCISEMAYSLENAKLMVRDLQAAIEVVEHYRQNKA